MSYWAFCRATSRFLYFVTKSCEGALSVAKSKNNNDNNNNNKNNNKFKKVTTSQNYSHPNV